ncbi:tyrosine-type recombinase/integrase [Acetobacter orientalis]|uniref:tyrosine-type recombinase/integrase n=1 Tax=Acetobacter orientalis TaxID=146474 RepID=UPI00209EF175|nr:tyrosine-type recombinase/integrase [Acetobacter orientalis]MCP1215613.1 tyrosine-type recombinase/integrase [Acetobacter orientalis]MCP1217534.1 tyrosine-type recombinase/integrase [Acetobacter orientalis]
MARIELPYVDKATTKGKTYYYYRREGQRLRIQGSPGEPQFLANYTRLHNAAEKAEIKAKTRPGVLPGSLAALIVAYKKSPEWTDTAQSTKVDYLKALDPLATLYGHLLVADMPRKFVFWLRDHYATKPAEKEGDPPTKTPRRANRMITVLSILLSWAVNREWRPDNPALRVPKLKTGEGYRAWTDSELEQMLTAPTTTEDIRAAVILALATGQRGQDLIKMMWTDYDGEGIYIVQGKTKARVWVPLHDRARQMLNTMPRTLASTILTRADGQPWKIDHFRHEMGDQIREAGLVGLVTHGLRTTAAKWLAEAGCSEREIMAITGHTSSTMVSRYVREASQKTRAKSAAEKVARYREKEASAKPGKNRVPNPRDLGSILTEKNTELS